MRERGRELMRIRRESVDLIPFQGFFFFLNVFHDSEEKGKQNKL